MEDSKVTFPQANHIERVIRVMSVDSPEEIKDKAHMCKILGNITGRQVQYYLAACEYLGLTKADRTFTELGEYVRNLPYTAKVIQMARIILADSVFGTVYFSEKKYGYKFDIEEIIAVMRLYCDLSEPVYRRRAQTVSSWLKWINELFNDTFINS